MIKYSDIFKMCHAYSHNMSTYNRWHCIVHYDAWYTVVMSMFTHICVFVRV